MSGVALGLALWLLAARPNPPPPSPVGLWLRVAWESDFLPPAFPYSTEILIFREGLYLELDGGPEGVRGIFRANAPRPAVEALSQALVEHRIGFAEGNCGVLFDDSSRVHHFTITWFGQFPRSHTFEVQSPGHPPCSEATGGIFAAIWAYRLEARSDLEATAAWLSAPPPLCGLAAPRLETP